MVEALIYGIDEAGRGPLAGPVVAACVHIPPEAMTKDFWQGVTDSKKLSAKKRESLFGLIQEHSCWGIAQASAQEIDQLNIHHATLLAMSRAFDLCRKGEGAMEVLVDGKFCPKLPCPARAVVKGDSLHVQIAAASILAKVTRDRLMSELDALFPAYGWAKNAGYGTAQHMNALVEHGVTIHHRMSYAPCAQHAKAA